MCNKTDASCPKQQRKMQAARRKNQRLRQKRGKRGRGGGITDRNPRAATVDFYGRVKDDIKPMEMYKKKPSSEGTVTRSTPLIWTAQRVTRVYSGSKAFDSGLKFAREKATSAAFRTPAPLPWRNKNNIYLREWTPAKRRND